MTPHVTDLGVATCVVLSIIFRTWRGISRVALQDISLVLPGLLAHGCFHSAYLSLEQAQRFQSSAKQHYTKCCHWQEDDILEQQKTFLNKRMLCPSKRTTSHKSWPYLSAADDNRSNAFGRNFITALKFSDSLSQDSKTRAASTEVNHLVRNPRPC